MMAGSITSLYWKPEIHFGSFGLPPYIARQLGWGARLAKVVQCQCALQPTD
jgi:hypothetical protein